MEHENLLRGPAASTELGQPRCEVVVRDIRVGADIGIHPHEAGRRQALTITARLGLRRPPEEHIADTIDYGDVVAFATRLAERRTALIETFAYQMAELCLSSPHVYEAEIWVEKAAGLANGVPAAVVRLARARPVAASPPPPA